MGRINQSGKVFIIAVLSVFIVQGHLLQGKSGQYDLMHCAAAAASDADENSIAGNEGNDPVTVRYRLKWLLNMSVAGDIYARDAGIFAKAGLEVDLMEGGVGKDAIRDLETGRAEFGIASADQVIRALNKGAPVRVLAQLFQVNPLQWVFRADRPAPASPADLKGKRLGVTFGGNDEAIMRTLMAKGGLSESDVTLFSVRYDLTPFYRDQVDFWPVYRNSQGPLIAAAMKKEGEEIRFLDPGEFGVKFVANSVITSEKILRRSPELVRKFTGSLLAGWEAAFSPENKSASIEMVRKYDRDTPPERLAEQYELTRKMVLPEGDTPFGTVDTEAWRQTARIMEEQGLIGKPPPLDTALGPAMKSETGAD